MNMERTKLSTSQIVNFRLDMNPRSRKAGARWRCAFVLLGGCLILVYLAVRKDPNGAAVAGVNVFFHEDSYSESRTIPKIIHQIWSDEIVPDQFVKHIRSVAKYNPHPEWEYYFWTLDIGGEFIRDHYPKLKTIYAKARKITKAEMLRTVIIYHYGGVYFDLDIVCVRPLDRFVEKHECSLVGPIPVFFVAYDQKIEYRNLNSAIYMCRARHPFFKLHVERLGIRSESCVSSETCPVPDFPAPQLIELTDKGENSSMVPEIVDYEMFDPKYDTSVTSSIERKCSGELYKRLEPAKQVICEDWKKYGKEDRRVGEHAYTFHTWYHANARKYTIDPKNHISNIVPHVKVYRSSLNDIMR